jgi:hypothetical protein
MGEAEHPRRIINDKPVSSYPFEINYINDYTINVCQGIEKYRKT